MHIFFENFRICHAQPELTSGHLSREPETAPYNKKKKPRHYCTNKAQDIQAMSDKKSLGYSLGYPAISY